MAVKQKVKVGTRRKSATRQSPASKTPAKAPKKPEFAVIFQHLRSILKPYERESVVLQDRSGDYYLNSKLVHEGKALFFAGVTIRSSYVSYYLYPLHCFPDLKKNMSQALRSRLPGTKCFNFTKVDVAVFKELAALTKAGAEALQVREITPGT
jgi:hypothetical protein